jgi:hypothetical protein
MMPFVGATVCVGTLLAPMSTQPSGVTNEKQHYGGGAMQANTQGRNKGSSVLGFILQAIIAGIFVGLFSLAIGSVVAASAGEPSGKPAEERSWVRQVFEMSILGAEASERGSQSGSTG